MDPALLFIMRHIGSRLQHCLHRLRWRPWPRRTEV